MSTRSILRSTIHAPAHDVYAPTLTVRSVMALRSILPPLILIVLAGFAIRLYRLGRQSLWYDETVSAYLAGQSIPGLIAHTARDIHPPGYYLLLHGWAGLAGSSEFALAFFSLAWGVLLIPLTYQLARLLAGRRTVAAWAALLVAFSPYHVWYSQEVRMYTLGAALGIVATWCALAALRRPATARRAWLGYALASALGLYTLYYFAFLLLIVNLFLLAYLHLAHEPARRSQAPLLAASGLAVLLYLPWLLVAWRQVVTPPVPPWRSPGSLSPWPALLESWTALALGQSVEPAEFWPILVLVLALFGLGLAYLGSTSRPRFPAGLFLLVYTFGPLLLIHLVSLATPLYHVRYIFTYSPAFYVVVGAGLARLVRRGYRWPAWIAGSLLLAACFFSLVRFHLDSRYQADDYRAAVAFIDRHWQPGDALLVNAGYTYTAYLYYTHLPGLERRRLVPYQAPAHPDQPVLRMTGTVDGRPTLGWGDPQADFYAMPAAETVAALQRLAGDYRRLWLLRAYDTVTDPTGLIRGWLAEHAIPLEDQPFTGPSNIRAQGFLFKAQPAPAGGETIRFEDGMVLAGWQLPQQSWQAGQTIHLQFWWLAAAPPATDYKMSLKLWRPDGQLAAQGQDTWPGGSLYRATAWPLNRPVYQPASLTLPPDLAPGQYWLNVELYHPETVRPLPRLDGDAAVTLGPVSVAP